MKHGALFNGIGGFQLAAQWAGFENVWHSEIDEYCNKVTKKNFPNSINLGDIKNVTRETPTVDVISGGFPCQEFSVAGKRGGDLTLWNEMFRVVREIRPTYVICENVAGLTSMDDGRTFNNILTSMEDIGYQVESFIIPACSVGAWHRRNRVWIIAYTSSEGFQERFLQQGIQSEEGRYDYGQNTTLDIRRTSEPELVRKLHGIPNRTHRIKALGNAIVPQVALKFFECIKQLESNV